MRRLPALTLLFALGLAPGAAATAQSDASIAQRDSVFKRARRMVVEGNGAAGRAIVDSLLRSADAATPAYGDALYWHGALAETAAEAERDYRRVIVEYPLSHYADDALLAIVELEQARGDRAGALAHLQRYVREHPIGTARGTAALAAARLAFEQRDTRTGCGLIADARASISARDVELRNQIDYFGTRCASASAEPAAQPTAPPTVAVVPPGRDTGVTPPTVKKTTPPARTTPPPTKTASRPAPPPASPRGSTRAPEVARPAPKENAKERGTYTIQVAAYGTRADADRLVAKLAARGVKARISGTSKPFRVRLDFYPTRQAALDEVAVLKEKGIVGFVTTETPAPEGRSP